MSEPPAPPKQDDGWGEEEEKTGFKKWGTPLILGVLAISAAFVLGKKLMNADGSTAKKETSAMMVQIVAPPPVAPTPPPPPPKEEVREDKQVDEKEDEAPAPEPAVTTANANSKGSGGIVLQKGNNAFFRKPVDNGAATKYRGFSSQVAKSIEDALRRNPTSKTAAGSAPVVRVWTDAGGKITRVKLETSTGNNTLDSAIESLTGLQGPGVTPADMPQPIRVRITLRRPN